MLTNLKGITPTRVIAALTLAVACSVIALGILQAGIGSIAPIHLIVALGLLGSLILAYRFPLRLQRYMIMHATGVPLYLAVVLLPPALAAATIGLGTLAGEVTTCRRCANPLSHALTHTGRWALVTFLASTMAHLNFRIAGGIFGDLPLVEAGGILWIGDFLTVLLVLAPMTGASPLRLLRNLVRQAGASEGVQYVIGLIATLAALTHIWVLPLLPLPMGIVYFALKQAQERAEDTRLFLESMADAVDLRDPYTGGHSRRVTDFTVGILRELGEYGTEADLIISAARVHDIGKIGVPDHVLLKPGKLSPEEWILMKAHPDHGAQLLMRYRDLARGAGIVRHHHEAWDGTGYPSQLAATDIPFGARVIAVADSFDAMTSDRPYRPGMPLQQAAKILSEGRGQQWDPVIVDAFLRAIEDQLKEPPSPVRLQSVSGW